MIRIDEIYNNTFWPWLQQNRPGTRLFFCDPFGHTDPEHLFNLSNTGVKQTDFVFMHDQEPVDLDIFESLFNEVMIRNVDIACNGIDYISLDPRVTWTDDVFKDNWVQTTRTASQLDFLRNNIDQYNEWKKHNPALFDFGNIIISEHGEYVEKLCEKYGWKSHYYFYHGWACLDWFRGYDKTFLMPRARDRRPTKTFMSPNRIVGGQRDHRVLFLYHVFKNKLTTMNISAPRVCPYEGVDISVIAKKYCNQYPDITNVLANADLPRLFDGESEQQMTSCWLTNFNEAADSLIYVPTETVYFGRRLHLTEKTFKAIALEMPFVLVAPAGSLAYLREYGFKTFAGILDESYDVEIDDIRRIELVTQLLKDLDNLSVRERQQIHRACVPIVEHNYNHFYGGDFANILWKEMTDMLEGLRV
jgi:hypothetical protein